MQALPNATLPVSRWHNGAGRKADLGTGEGWLAGFAWLDADAPFSSLPGMDRTITLVEGPGFTLDIEGHPLPVHKSFTPTRFDGGAPTRCRILGQSRVLNAMTDRARYTHSVTIVEHSTPLDPVGSVAYFVVLLSGAATLREAETTLTLKPLDAARLHAPADIQLRENGRAAVVMIHELAMAA